ncbi:MAG: 3-hydroxyacyl-CoA dehydrogenase NAD-binding domain-containing protein [Promethearchaeota archaeon]
MVDIKNIVIIGVSLKGAGISQVALMADYKVTLIDFKQEIVNKAATNIEKSLKKLETKNKLGNGKSAADILKNLKISTDLIKSLRNADFIVENVLEDMSTTQNLFKKCGEKSPAHATLSTNTSMMSITQIAKESGRPEKCIGMHFFHPVPLMRLIEIIPGERTSDETINIAVKIADEFPCLRGKRYIAKVLKDRPGFIVNRLNAPVQIYLSWIFDQAAEKCIPWESIDADGGDIMPMPPCVLFDYIGIDTVVNALNYYQDKLSPDFKPGKVITELYELGNFGAKTGKGFYDWSQGRPKPKFSQKAGLFDLNITFAITLNEGCRILEEGIVKGFKTIDDANMAGMNVPGPFAAGKRNYKKWSEMLEKLSDESGIEYFRPCRLMKTGEFLKMRK